MSIVTTISPSGHGVKFQSHPPRGYWIMEDATPAKMIDDKAWGRRLTSVTTVLNVIDKPALKWWGQNIGIVGTLTLVREGILGITDDGYEVLKPKLLEMLQVAIAEDVEKDLGKLVTEEQQIAKLLTFKKLTVNHVTRKAAKRGTTAHDAFETWANTGILPEPTAYPDDQRGYVYALRKFFDENDMTDCETEVCIASPKHRFGGRYDIRGRLNGGPLELMDVKTSKDVYSTHFIQMEGYEGASVELGYEPTEARAVIHLGKDGEWKIMRSDEMTRDGQPCTYDDFLAALRLSRVMDRLGGL